MALLLLGPAGGIGLYWALYRYYRNTDKSHAFERETKVDAQARDRLRPQGRLPTTARRESRITGDNVSEYRKRVERIRNDSSR